jgi:hypothetical protein
MSLFNNIINSLDASINNSFNTGSFSVDSVGRDIRMISNAEQDVKAGATPDTPRIAPAVAVQDITRPDAESTDWRVSLAVPSVIASSPILEPLRQTGSRMIFPFTPTVLLQQEANYSTITPTHSNYPYHAYQNSQVAAITITGEFVNENEEDGQYYIAVLHFLRTMTKMFYGEGENSGNPPLLSRLNGYGKYVLNDIPVVITNFNLDLPQEVDYIETRVGGEINYVPTSSMITVTCAPNYSRRSLAGFNLKKFADGGFIGQGFI